jgi:ATP-dependent RNA helicase DHX57
VFVREVTMVPTYSLLLFGGAIEVLHQENMVTVDNWVKFHAPAKIAVLFRRVPMQHPPLAKRTEPSCAWDRQIDI